MFETFTENPEEQLSCLDCDRPLATHAHSNRCPYCEQSELDFQKYLAACLSTASSSLSTSPAINSSCAFLHVA